MVIPHEMEPRDLAESAQERGWVSGRGLCNWIVAALPSSDRVRIYPLLRMAQLRRGQVLSQSMAWLPISATICVAHSLPDGSSSEIATVGCEGVVGLLRKGFPSALRGSVTVLAGGSAWQVAAVPFMRFASGHAALNALLWEYVPALVCQASICALCNRHHSLQQQFCRRLLQWTHLAQTNSVHITQEQMAQAMGVRREGVSETASLLKRAGVIRYSRGCVQVVDRRRLLGYSCECYLLWHRQRARLAYAPVQERDGKKVNGL